MKRPTMLRLAAAAVALALYWAALSAMVFMPSEGSAPGTDERGLSLPAPRTLT